MSKNTKEIIRQKSTDIFSQIVSYRRYLHQNPELSFDESGTAKYISEILKEHNIEIDNSFGENAVIGIIRGKNEKQSIALRADIDALPITETNNCDYVSKNTGIMHACGHDAHTASLLGTAIILNKIKDSLAHNVILIFQPAEEKNPGGAKMLIEKGILKKYNIKKIIAQHVNPNVKTGHFCFGSGHLMASTDEIHIRFKGIGGHASIPEKRSDVVLSMVEFIAMANELSNELNKKSPVLIAFGKVIADGSVNVVPSELVIEGTMRSFDEKIRKHIKDNLKRFAENAAKSYKNTVDFKILDGYPSLFNDIFLSEEILNHAKEYLSEKNIEIFEQRMTADDFSYFSKEIPAVLYRTGIEGNGFGQNSLHSSNFDIDENMFIDSVGLMAYIAIMINN